MEKKEFPQHKRQKIRIEPRKEGEIPSNVHVFINDTEIRDIRDLRFEVKPGEFPHLILDVNAWDISINANSLLYQKGVGKVNFVPAYDEDELQDIHEFLKEEKEKDQKLRSVPL